MRRLCFSLIIFVSLIYISCESSVENKIDGTWRRVNVSDMSSSINEEWTFLDGYIYIIQTQTDSTLPLPDTINNGEYNIKIKRLKRYVCLSGCTNIWYDGDYNITKLNNKYLVIVGNMADGKYYEFVKK